MSNELSVEVELLVRRELENLPSMQRDKEGLQRLISQIISSSTMPARYKSEVRDHADSSIVVKSTRVSTEKYDSATSRLPVRIQLEGCIEKWIIDIYPTKEAQKDLKGFAEGIKQSASTINERFKQHAKDDVIGSRKGDDSTAPQGGSDVRPDRIKNPQRRTSDALRKEVICALLEKCLERGGVLRIIEQSDFISFLKEFNVDCNTLLAVNYLKKEGFIEVKAIPRRPQLIVTLVGCALVAAHNQQKAEEQEKANKLALQEEALQFPAKAHSLLVKMRSIFILNQKAQEFLELEREQLKLNENLRAELLAGEKKLEDLRKEKQKLLNRMEESVSRINSNALDQMIELAEKTSTASS